MLHPKTCGFLTQNDHLVFQPCRYKCLTDGGHNTCWCNVTVHHDIRCNIAELLRKNAWGGIEADRQLTTTVISLFALLPEGVRKKVGIYSTRFLPEVLQEIDAAGNVHESIGFKDFCGIMADARGLSRADDVSAEE